jgi:predicted Zn-dependent protease
MRPAFAVALVSVVLPIAVMGQAPASADAAEKAYTSQNWAEAERQYSELTQQQPENARFWYRFGVSARADKHFTAALEAMQKGKSLGAGRGLQAFVADYEIATTYAGMGDSAHALEILKSSANAGFMMPSRLQNDTEWNGLRSNEQFIALAKQIQHNAAPLRRCGIQAV